MDANHQRTTRRSFTSSTATTITLTVIGCGKDTPTDQSSEEKEPELRKKAQLATEPFLVGAVEQYRAAGVYDAFWDSKDVYLISDGQQLTAVAALCTHLNCTTHWQPEKEHFYCPCHQSLFDKNGRNIEDDKAKRPLDRCAIAIIDTPSGKQVQVDPTVRFREDEDEFEDTQSYLVL